MARTTVAIATAEATPANDTGDAQAHAERSVPPLAEFAAREMQRHNAVAHDCLTRMLPDIERAAAAVVRTIAAGNRIFLFGNGGSAADAQHIAAEFTGHFMVERGPLPAIALTTDTSALTAIGNDYGYEHVFSRQLLALARPGDLAVGISTSGNSENVVRGLQQANASGCTTLGLLGGAGGKAARMCDLPLVVPTPETPRIQEMHILIGHILCSAVDHCAGRTR